MTGGGRGIGAAVCNALALRGACVVIVYRSDQAYANRTLQTLPIPCQQDHAIFQCDVGDANAVGALLARVVDKVLLTKDQANPPPPPNRRPNSADLADLFCRFVGFLNFANWSCRLVGASGILGHLIWRCHAKMSFTYIFSFGTLDNTFSFYVGSSDWHHEVLLLPTKRRVSGPLGFIVPH